MKNIVDPAERLRAELFPRLEWAEDLSGRRFAIVGAFERFPRYLGRTPAEAVLGRGGVVEEAVTAGLDYAVFGKGRGKGKVEAQRQAEKLAATGKPVVLDEAGFIHLLRPKLDGARFHVAGELDFGRGAAATAPAALVTPHRERTPLFSGTTATTRAWLAKRRGPTVQNHPAPSTRQRRPSRLAGAGNTLPVVREAP